MSRRLPKPDQSQAVRVDWDDANRRALAVAAANCDLSTASFARLALELVVLGKAPVTVGLIEAEANKRLPKKKPKK